MANTYTQLGIHIVTAVSGRQSLIGPDIRKRVEAFIKDVIYGRDHVVIAIYVMPNHMHVFISLNPKDSISDLVAAFKSQSSGFIQREFIEGFSWQRGYGAFAVSKSHWEIVKRYIENQEEHHRAQTLQQEIRQMLEDQGVEYDERYLFDEVD
jgi:REP element-mobilizing transposase RayT